METEKPYAGLVMWSGWESGTPTKVVCSVAGGIEEVCMIVGDCDSFDEPAYIPALQCEVLELPMVD